MLAFSSERPDAVVVVVVVGRTTPQHVDVVLLYSECPNSVVVVVAVGSAGSMNGTRSVSSRFRGVVWRMQRVVRMVKQPRYFSRSDGVSPPRHAYGVYSTRYKKQERPTLNLSLSLTSIFVRSKQAGKQENEVIGMTRCTFNVWDSHHLNYEPNPPPPLLPSSPRLPSPPLSQLNLDINSTSAS